MFILFMVFILQFSVSCACLAINKEQQVIIVCTTLTRWYWFPHSWVLKCKCFVLLQNLLLEIGWNKSESMQEDLERSLDCCDFLEVNYNESCVAVRTIILPFNPRLMNNEVILLLLELNVKNRMCLERPFKHLEQMVGECVYIVSFGKYCILYINMLGQRL